VARQHQHLVAELPEGGFDYTAADCMGWMPRRVFTETRAEHLAGPDSMVIGIE
jgi:hypothetical protein